MSCPTPRLDATGLLVFPMLLLLACSADSPTAPAAVRAAGRADVIQPAATTTVVMSGLDAPKGLAWGPDGSLYVVESGTATIAGPCAEVVRGQNCYSGTGAISRLRGGVQERVASGLPSAYNPAIADFIGPSDIEFVGLGKAMVTIGWGATPRRDPGWAIWAVCSER